MMVDLHQHLVYAVDDGAEDLSVSLEMLERAVQQGVTDIVCTSHTMPGRHELILDRYFRFFDRLVSEIETSKLPVRLHTGTEILYTKDTARLLHEGRVPTLAESWNVLVEFRPDTTYDVMRQGLTDIANAGFSVILAHVERYGCLEDCDRLAELRQDCMVRTQMNANTVLRSGGLLGDRWAKHALRQDLVDVVASDAHNITSRPCRLGDAYHFLEKHYGKDRADRLCCDTPAEILKH